MTVINFDDIIGKKFETITNNIFCLNHPSNCLVIGKTNSGKTNIVMNLIAKNSIYEKIYIYSNNIDDKYNWLQNKFKNDVFIYINEIDFDKINKGYVNLIIFDDLVFSNKKVSEFYCRSRKLNCTCIFIGHRYFKNIDRTLKNNIDYLIFTQLDKKELNMLYQDINLNITLKEPYLLIDNVRFENPIPNDISAYKSLKSKSMYSNNFIINYDDYIDYYRIYFWSISRQIKDDNANKFINILTGMEESACEVYIVFKTSASITMKYSKNDKLIVYKSQ